MPVYCVRHGQSVANAGGLTMEHSTIPLSPLGVAQAAALPALPDRAVLFGHGIWFALLFWKLGGGDAIETSRGMASFRRFQRALPMPNCAVYALELQPSGQWSATADARVRHAMERIELVEASTWLDSVRLSRSDTIAATGASHRRRSFS